LSASYSGTLQRNLLECTVMKPPRSLTHLQDYTFAIVDTETTGTSAQHGQIIEIGILRVERGQVVRTYQTLVQPARPLPPVITSITGIRDKDLIHAPTFDEVALEIREMLDGAIVVAHNARFDYSFIKNEFKRLGIAFTAKTLCTVTLSRTLFPQYSHHNLDAVVQAHGLVCKNRHRAFDDAEALWQFLHAIESKVDKQALQNTVAELLGRHTLPPGAPKNILAGLPNSPGIYIFYGAQREVLYVGKSINIRKRVMSHFSGDHESAKELRMTSEVVSVEFEVTTGELSALLLESRRIKELMPVYNRALRKARQLTVVTLAVQDNQYNTIDISYQDEVEPEPGQVLGIFRTKRQAKDFLQNAVREHGLCPKQLGLESGAGACFQHQLGRCAGACVGAEPAVLYNARFDAVFAERRIRIWPYKGAIVVKEDPTQEEGVAYVIDQWRLVSTLSYDSDTISHQQAVDSSFDYDAYKIITRHLLKKHIERTVVPLSALDNQLGHDEVVYF
jgi:DNA polymerase-3 subunit epsilon